MSEALPLQPEQTFARGRFVLVKRLGRGGMGEVWLARDERLREPVALKFLPPEIRGDPGALDDLRRETARSHQLSHPNIVRIHDLYEDPDGMAFIVMEYIDGPTLAVLRLQQPARVLSWEFLRPLVAQLCAALEYAHGEKVIHRDLKPANLMVDSRGRLKLADFGIAAVASDTMSRVSVKRSASGTLPYMSPQQVTGQRPRWTDDIYALGATLYELLTGKPPFYTGDLTHQVLNEAPEPMAERLGGLQIQNDIPPDAAALIMACLAKEPGERPQSARVVAQWIGLETVAKPSTESPAAALPPPTPSLSEAVADKPAEEGSSKPAGFGRNLAAVGIVAVVMAAALWLRQESLRRGNHSASPAVKVAAQAKPPGKLNGPLEAATNPAPASPGTGATSRAPGLAADNPGHAGAQDMAELWTFATFAGKAGSPGHADGTGSNARFVQPRGIAMDPQGNLLVADCGNSSIRRITPAGQVSTFAQGARGAIAGAGVQMKNAPLYDPIAVAVDGSGIIYAATSLTTICKITPEGARSTIAGPAGTPGRIAGRGAGPRFFQIESLAADAGGNLYVADMAGQTIRKITPGGEVSTLAGGAGNQGLTGGPTVVAPIVGPGGVAAAPGKEMGALAGDPEPITRPRGVTVGPTGDVYVADAFTIRKITPARVVSTLAGQAGRSGHADGPANRALFDQPQAIRLDCDGSLLVLESDTRTIRRITPDGAVSTVAHFGEDVHDANGASAAGTFRDCSDFALDTEGNLYIADAGDNIILKGIRRPGQPAAIVESRNLPVKAPAQAGPAGQGKAPSASTPAEAAGLALIPAGPFTMGDSLDGQRDAIPTVPVYVSAFYMDRNLVSYGQWQSVANWATSHGYQRLRAHPGQEANHPVVGLDWNECVIWCNVRSQQAGLTPVYYTDAGLTQVYTDATTRNGLVTPYANWNASGFRLPTEAEWEKAARGGLNEQRFPWGNTISERQANYRADTSYDYDLGPYGYNAAFMNGGSGGTSPAGSFAPNGYGLYDMAGNVMQWCWDWYGTPYEGGEDPRGPASGHNHVERGGSWNSTAYCSRCACRFQAGTNTASGWDGGFRCVRRVENALIQGLPAQAANSQMPITYPPVPAQRNATAVPAQRSSLPIQQQKGRPPSR